MNKFIFIIIFLMPSAYSYVPSVESLFKNSSNESLGSKHITINTKVSSEDQSVSYLVDIVFLLKYSQVDIPEVQESEVLLFSKKLETFKVLVVFFSAQDSLRKKPLKTYYFSNIPALLNTHQQDSYKNFFYAALATAFTNSPYLAIELMKKYRIPVEYDKDILNKEKYDWLLSYKKSLEENQKISLNYSLLTQNIFVENPLISLVKEGEDFYWSLMKDSFAVFFSSQDHLLRKVSYQDHEFTFENFRFIKKQKIPQYLKWKTAEGRTFLFDMYQVKYLEPIDNLSFLYEKYRKEIGDSTKVVETIF